MQLIKIYTLSDPDTKEVRYVGKTKFTLSKRLSQHICEKRSNKRTSWVKSILKRGKMPLIELLSECSEDKWIDEEKFYISYFRYIGVRLVNATEGGDGVVFTKEIRDKISKAHKGKKLSEEHKQKLMGNKNCLGRVMPEEHRKKISESNKGKKHSDETRRKMSDITPKKKIAKIDKNTGEVLRVYNSISECCKIHRYSKGNIIKVCKNRTRKDGSKCNTSYGFKWKYV